jgi:hypothetical protein
LSRTKLIAAISLAVTIITMIASNQPLVYASSTTEDDGYTYPDDASEEEKEGTDEREQEAWEDAGRPGERDDDNRDDDDNDDNGDDEEQIFTCSDGSTVTEDEECPPTGPNPYCDTERGKAAPVCHDRKDYDQDTGLYPCNDGTNKVDWRDCKDATVKNDDDNSKTLQTTTTTATSVEESSCRLDGSADGIQQKFNPVRYQACGLYPNGQIAYTDGFVVGCTQVGNTQQLCQAFVVMNTQPTQTAATQPNMQSTTQPTQAIQPSGVS